VNKALSDARLLAHVLVHVERRSAVGLGEVHVCLLLEFAVELLELVLYGGPSNKRNISTHFSMSTVNKSIVA
jgi:hypothetical protein